jgi:hypothetical protein
MRYNITVSSQVVQSIAKYTETLTDIVTVHTIMIFGLYVGIIAAIQEHAYDHCHINVSGACLPISEPIGSHT